MGTKYIFMSKQKKNITKKGRKWEENGHGRNGKMRLENCLANAEQQREKERENERKLKNISDKISKSKQKKQKSFVN